MSIRSYLINKYKQNIAYIKQARKGEVPPNLRTSYLINLTLFSVLILGSISIGLIYLIHIIGSWGDIYTEKNILRFIFHMNYKGEITGILTNSTMKYYFAALVAIIPTLLIWNFRNHDRLVELETAKQNTETAQQNTENSRKDTNLKDFQQLQKWASGSDEATHDGKPFTEKKPEINNPLQISAIHQLGGFFRGEFGDQFQRPAYELLHALWVNQFADLKDQLFEIKKSNKSDNSYRISEKYRELLLSKTRNPIADAIITVVFGDGGDTLVKLEELRTEHNKNSPSLIRDRDWRGLNSDESIELKYKELYSINFSCSYLFYANFSGTNLLYSDLSYAYLSYARFSGAKLTNVDLSNAILRKANLTDADLTRANLSGVNLNEADLSGTDLNETIFLNLRDYTFAEKTAEYKNANEAIYGFYEVDDSSKIKIDWNKTNELRAQFGLDALKTKAEREKLHKLINDYLDDKERKLKTAK